MKMIELEEKVIKSMTFYVFDMVKPYIGTYYLRGNTSANHTGLFTT